MPSLPDGWQIAPLGRLCEISIGGTPSRDVARYWASDGDEGEPWVAISDMARRVLFETKERISPAGIANSNVKRVPANTVLMSFKLTLGRVAIAGRDLYTNEAIAAFRPAAEVDRGYLYYALPDAVRRTATDVAIKGATLNKASLSTIPVAYPDLIAQQRIAAILTSIDNAIEATEALIEKHQQIKAGLMHDLFTRGVLASGARRPPPAQAPEFYDASELGPLPKGWSLSSLQSLLAPVTNNLRSGPFGSALLKHELSETGIPLLGIDNIHIERFVPQYSRFVSDRKFLGLARYAVRPRDVVITIMGTVGRCCVVPDDIGTALSSKHLWTMTLDAERVIPELVCWQLNHAPWARAWFRRGGQGGIMDAIQSSTLRSLRLPTPPMDEQVRMKAIYAAAQSRIHSEAMQLAKLRAQKLGLMQDLLTGKVRVPAAPAAAAHA